MELREYMRILLKRWWLIGSLTLLSLVTALLFSYAQTPIYESTSTYVTKLNTGLPNNADTADTGIYAMDTLTGRARIFVTYCQIMTSQAVRAEAFSLLSLDSTAVDTTKYDVFCTNLPETNVLLVTVQGPSPELVKRLNEAIGVAGVSRTNSLYSFYPLEPLDPVALAEDQVSPKHSQNAILGGALGLAVGITLALMVEYLRSPLERLEAMSIRHPQMGVYNERYFKQRLEEETNRAHARLRPISVALVRLHPNEDFALLPEQVQTALLRNAAVLMEDQIRQGDILAYVKPQTFGILLAETPGDEAQTLLQQLHTDIRSHTFEVKGYVSSFIANTGVVASSGGSIGYQAMLDKAGEALITAEQIGENTIHLIRATPRPFLTSGETDADESTTTLPFGSAVSPFDMSGDESTWTPPPADSSITKWRVAANGKFQAPEDTEIANPNDSTPSRS
jgi:diguanylate cyclase (GGDEF)-like protein